MSKARFKIDAAMLPVFACGEILVPLGVLNFIHADGADALQFAMLQADGEGLPAGLATAEREEDRIWRTQAGRKQREQAQLEHASEIYKLFEMQKIDWNPAGDGFVLSKAQIAANVRRQHHLDQAAIAYGIGFNLKRYRDAVA